MIAPVTIDNFNLDTAKQELVRYHNTGVYMHEIATVDQDAKNYLLTRIKQNEKLDKPKKLAIVLDIDETSLSNYPDMLKMNFGGTHAAILSAIMQATDPVIPPTLELFQTAEKNNVAVFFITGRPENSRPATVKNLDAAGYFKYTGLYMRPDNDTQPSVVPFKLNARKDITQKGYDIVLSLGDQNSDFTGGYEDKKFKLPNPYYYLA